MNSVKKVFCLFHLLYSDFRSRKIDAQQLIKNLNLCPGQSSLRDVQENVSELFLSWAALLWVIVLKCRKDRQNSNSNTGTAVFISEYCPTITYKPIKPGHLSSLHLLSKHTAYLNLREIWCLTAPLSSQKKLAEVSQLLVTRQKLNK